MGYLLLILLGLFFLFWLFAQIYNFFNPHASERWEQERKEYNNVVKKDNYQSFVTNDKDNFSGNTYLAKYYPLIHYSIHYKSSWIRFKYVLTKNVEYVKIEIWKFYKSSYIYDKSVYGDQLKSYQKICDMYINIDTLFIRKIQVYIIVKPIGGKPYKYEEFFNV